MNHYLSPIISNEENRQIIYCLGRGREIVYSTASQIYFVDNKNSHLWKFGGTGIICLVKNHIAKTFVLVFFDFKSKSLSFKQDLYCNMPYVDQSKYLHSFETKDSIVGLNFAFDNDASILFKNVKNKLEFINNQKDFCKVEKAEINICKDSKQKSEKNTAFLKKKKSKINFENLSISDPKDFRVMLHCGKSGIILDDQTKTKLEEIGLSSEQINDPRNMSTFIRKISECKGNSKNINAFDFSELKKTTTINKETPQPPINDHFQKNQEYQANTKYLFQNINNINFNSSKNVLNENENYEILNTFQPEIKNSCTNFSELPSNNLNLQSEISNLDRAKKIEINTSSNITFNPNLNATLNTNKSNNYENCPQSHDRNKLLSEISRDSNMPHPYMNSVNSSFISPKNSTLDIHKTEILNKNKIPTEDIRFDNRNIHDVKDLKHESTISQSVAKKESPRGDLLSQIQNNKFELKNIGDNLKQKPSECKVKKPVNLLSEIRTGAQLRPLPKSKTDQKEVCNEPHGIMISIMNALNERKANLNSSDTSDNEDW